MKRLLNNKKKREILLRLGPISYLVLHWNFHSWAIFHIQRLQWKSSSIEWHVWIGPLEIRHNDYGTLVRPDNWPKEWSP